MLNSGLHDVAPFWGCGGVAWVPASSRETPARGANRTAGACGDDGAPRPQPPPGAWHGDKPAALAHYAARLGALFDALARAGLARKVLWRTTTFPAALHARELRGTNPTTRWYERCDTQALRVDTVRELNAIAVAAARERGIAVWDVAGLSLDARREHFADAVHPTHAYAEAWAHMLAHHEVIVNASAAARRRRE